MSKEAERRARLEAAMGGASARRAPRAPAGPGTAPPARAERAAEPAGRPYAAASRPGSAATPLRGLAIVADRRGLTAVGIVLVCAVGCVIGASWDLTRGTRILGGVTGTALVIAAVLAALAAHREDLGASVVAPPLCYAVVVLVAANITGRSGTGSYVHRVGSEVVVHVLTSAPGLLIAFGLTVLVALVRWLSGRAAANRRRASARMQLH